MDGLLNMPEIGLLKSMRVEETTEGSCAGRELIPDRDITG